MGQDEDTNQNNDAVDRIRGLMRQKNYNEVADLIISLDAANRENRMAMTIEEQAYYFSVLIHSYLFDDYVSGFYQFISI